MSTGMKIMDWLIFSLEKEIWHVLKKPRAPFGEELGFWLGIKNGMRIDVLDMSGGSPKVLAICVAESSSITR
ncbi:hypothetical protein L3V64_014920 [Geobacillus stearothermophilus]|uniref:hypothetical protein n=1 Tax=Geobacillus stearothermophilus TaxID=1422 RepID=UPI001F1C7248|nr:hypothetical protein [Geobacillus stearothermophilus]MCK7607583.1 hypothetical protein [Geobacillus stearothermophilus]